MTAFLQIQRAGPAMTIQDSGRPGYARFGLSCGGAMDPYAMAEGCALLANPPDAAAIEMAGAGGEFVIGGEPTWLALSGAAMQASLDDAPLVWRQSFLAQPGQVLKIGGVVTDADTAGTYGYLHVAGGFDTPRQMDSRSNHLRAGIGGLDGKVLSSGLVLPLAGSTHQPQSEGALPPPTYLGRREIRILWGPQSNRFAETTRQRLLEETFRMSHRRDRMAMRLELASGEPLESLLSGISDPAMVGDIQVTGDGMPAILMREHQPTGGYPRIASVISADLAAAAQIPVAQSISFRLVARDEAVSTLRQWRQEMHSLADRISPVLGSAGLAENLLDCNLIGGSSPPITTQEIRNDRANRNRPQRRSR